MSRLLGFVVAVLLIAPAVCAQEPTKRDFTGAVSDESAIAVPYANIRVWEAWPQQGVPQRCPTCYPDCGRLVQANEDGRYHIPQVDASLEFTVVITADGYLPVLSPRHVPFDGPLFMTLKRRDASVLRPAQIVKGRVLGADGKPLEGAIVEPGAVYFDQWKAARSGTAAGADALAVTDDKGLFTIVCASDMDGMDLLVKAPALAQGTFRRIAAAAGDGDPHEMRMIGGATIRGRIVRNGEPLPGVVVGVRSEETPDALGAAVPEAHTIGSDADGTFRFEHLNPGRGYVVYVTMESARPNGAATPRTVRAGTDGATSDAGELAVAPGHRVTGRLTLPEHAALVLPAKVVLSGVLTHDEQAVTLAPDGSFVLREVPSGDYILAIAMHGLVQPGGMPQRVTIDGDLADLSVPMEAAAAPAQPAGPRR